MSVIPKVSLHFLWLGRESPFYVCILWDHKKMLALKVVRENYNNPTKWNSTYSLNRCWAPIFHVFSHNQTLSKCCNTTFFLEDFRSVVSSLSPNSWLVTPKQIELFKSFQLGTSMKWIYVQCCRCEAWKWWQSLTKIHNPSDKVMEVFH